MNALNFQFIEKYFGDDFIQEIKTKPNPKIYIPGKLCEKIWYNSNDILYDTFQYIPDILY